MVAFSYQYLNITYFVLSKFLVKVGLEIDNFCENLCIAFYCVKLLYIFKKCASSHTFVMNY